MALRRRTYRIRRVTALLVARTNIKEVKPLFSNLHNKGVYLKGAQHIGYKGPWLSNGGRLRLGRGRWCPRRPLLLNLKGEDLGAYAWGRGGSPCPTAGPIGLERAGKAIAACGGACGRHWATPENPGPSGRGGRVPSPAAKAALALQFIIIENLTWRCICVRHLILTTR